MGTKLPPCPLAFLANLVSKIGSIAIISTFLKGYVIIYICLGIIKCTIVAFYHFNNTRKNERPGHASCSGQGRRCRLDKEDKKQKAVEREDKKDKVVEKFSLFWAHTTLFKVRLMGDLNVLDDLAKLC